MKYYPRNYKEDLNSTSESKGREYIRNNESQLIGDDEGNLSYEDNNERAELENIISGETAYNREKELLDAINTPNNDENMSEGEYTEELEEVLNSKYDFPKDTTKIIDPDVIVDEDDTAYYDNKTSKKKKNKKGNRQQSRANLHEIYIG